MSNQGHEQKENLLKLIREALQRDVELREKYQMGEKFRFIRDRLRALLSHVEDSLSSMQKKEVKKTDEPLEDEELVYVYLYNAQGLDFKTWQKMLTPAVFYEYSVNRPIYATKAEIDSFIRSKTNKAHHGYLAVIIKKIEIIQTAVSKDAIGNPLIKVKEGSLTLARLKSFTHNGSEYTLNLAGELIKKT